MVVKPAGFRQDSEPLTAEAAEALTAEIVDILTNGYRKVVPLVIRAFRGRAWNALGFTSWDEYCKETFAGPRMLRLSDEQLTELCVEFADAGMSTRAIGSAAGIGHATAARKLNASKRKPADVIGLDERRQTRDRKRTASKEAHPAGKGLAPGTEDTFCEAGLDMAAYLATLSKTETALFYVGESGTDGLTYIELCEITGWRGGQATGALSALYRRGLIRESGKSREGCNAWIRQ